ncbi:single-stranded-DNA-specific exonuclease RecJ [Neoehrlichia mikurensis]|uniref:Single-stranded-DNA-specific exonuclease RecJ n=1 Tax=Neoehrlichia mikurensis TaxID=89586 RepID=A0A9Q9BVV4_9RICK|nr:single-stranded-DNA-specific exonuclease RecJ [Neoehrlichia mikurensis]UTO55796.1 single-stranded-DNA-specific exonuclease RecJ [Neoehrlichia mikurensis]UTO56711.1 single-stranded-DNA-specific exonuclease RecJ [Neoehrlichia mikurensis]
MLQQKISDSEYISVSESIWVVDEANTRDILAIQQRFGVCEIIARILSVKNIPIDKIDDFLYPTLRHMLPDPFHLLDMDKAINRIEQVIYNQEKIVVFGDYDVDGATSSALIKKYFKNLGVNIHIYIPDRIQEGYGPNTKAFLDLQKEGYSLCITVDCGTVAHEPISTAKSVGLDIIVIDHHISTDILPEAIAVINPNRLDESSPYTNLAAVGVTFLMIVALHKTLQKKNFFKDKQEPNLLDYLDLVALGTICDVMSITELNRVFIKQGLKVMAARKNLGLKILSDIIGIQEKPNTHLLGFIIGPHINAGGRIGNASLGAKLLSSESEEESIQIATQLQHLNIERKELENQSFNEALVQAEKLIFSGTNIIVVAHQSWHPGIIGIIAGRLKEKFNLPSIVISLNNGIGKASARSIPNVDIGAAILYAKFKNLIIEGGGHAMAAGFSIYEDKIQELYEFLSEKFSNISTQKTLRAISTITLDAVNLNLWQKLQLLEPFGIGNPEPRFILTNIKVKKPELINDNHIKCWIYDNKTFLKGICFRCANTALGMALLQCQVTMILGKISVNYWKGNENIQFIIEDVTV